MEKAIERIWRLKEECDSLHLDFDGYVYNPLSYGWRPHEKYQQMALKGKPRILILGMNPGPDGMAQTAVPFGSVSVCRDYLHINEPVDHPPKEHPKKRIDGFQHKKDEPSGRKIWGLIRDYYPQKEDFFKTATVQNFCPLCFLDREKGTNITPDRLTQKDRIKIEEICQSALKDIIGLLEIETAVAVGTYAEKQLKKIGTEREIRIIRILHPSPLTGVSEAEWRRRTEEQLLKEGIIRER